MFKVTIFFRPGFSIALAGVLTLAGCASPSPKAIAQADTAIQNADRAGTASYEPQLLAAARAKLNRAKKDVDANDVDEARRLAEEALSEAILANAKAEATKQAKATEEMNKAIDALKHETSRDSNGH